MLLRILSIFILPLLFNACGSMGWQSLKLDNISYNDLFHLTAHVIDSEGFVLDIIDPNEGSIVSGWEYNKILDIGRFPIRRKVEAIIDSLEERSYQLNLRIEQEALWKNYGVMDLEHKEGWEFYDYDKETTQNILTKIKLILEDFEPSKEFYDRWKRKDDFEKDVPEILKPETIDEIGG